MNSLLVLKISEPRPVNEELMEERIFTDLKPELILSPMIHLLWEIKLLHLGLLLLEPSQGINVLPLMVLLLLLE